MYERPRYPRILVAIDETPAAAFALRHVVPYALDQNSHLTLVSVATNPPSFAAAAGVSPQQLVEVVPRRRLIDVVCGDLGYQDRRPGVDVLRGDGFEVADLMGEIRHAVVLEDKARTKLVLGLGQLLVGDAVLRDVVQAGGCGSLDVRRSNPVERRDRN